MYYLLHCLLGDAYGAQNISLIFSCSVFIVLFNFLFQGEQDDFVRVNGTHFVHNGKPYYYAGTNLWYGCYIGSPGETGDRPRLLRELDSLHAIGLDNFRILAGSEASKKLRGIKPAILRSAGRGQRFSPRGLDFLLDEMSKRNMKGVLYLTNYWEWSGGMSEYVAWADTSHALDPEVDGWGKFMNFSAKFYQNEKANGYFRSYVKSDRQAQKQRKRKRLLRRSDDHVVAIGKRAPPGNRRRRTHPMFFHTIISGSTKRPVS